MASVASTPSVLAVFTLEFPHELGECMDAFLRKRVVDRGTDAADRTMPLQAVETRGRRLLDELLLQFLAGQPERDIHQRAAVLLRRAAIETGSIDFCVQDCCFP